MNNSELEQINQDRVHIPMEMKGETQDSLVDTALSNRNIQDKDEWQLGRINDIDFKSIYGLKYVDEFLQDIKFNDVTVKVLVDSDGDGFTSSALVINYLKKALNIDVKPLLPDIKIHGIAQYVNRFPDNFHFKQHFGLLDCVPSTFNDFGKKITWIMIPDSSSNDLETINKLYRNGYKCLIMDHHDMAQEVETEIFSSDVYKVISNQLRLYPLCREYTGVGMSYLVARYIDTKLGCNYANDYLDLMAVGQISDVSDVSVPEIHDYVMYGINHINNEFLQAYIDHDEPMISIKSIQFGVVPLMNAISRIGDIEERELLLKALTSVNNSDTYIYKTRKKQSNGKFKPIKVKTNLYEYAYFLLKKVKSLQDRTVKSAAKKLDVRVWDKLVIAMLPKKYDNGLTGLIANKLISIYNLPAFVFKESDNGFLGSGRVPEEISGIRQVADSLKHTLFAQGHDNAFGISIENIDTFANEFEDMLNGKTKITNGKQVSVTKYNAATYKYKIDYLYINERPSATECLQVYYDSLYWCGVKDEPVIGIVGLDLSKADIQIKNRLLRITLDGVTLVSFTAPEDVIDKLSVNHKLFVDIVGKPNINFFLNHTIPQVVIDKIRITGPVNNHTANDLIF